MSEDEKDLISINTRDATAGDPGELMSGLPHSKAIGMRLHKSTRETALLSVPWDEKLVGDPESGILHGGVITALLDTACGSAVMSMPEKLRSAATLDLRIDYTRPTTQGATVYARAECYRMTRSIGFARAVAYHDDPDDPIASAAGAFMIERPKEKTAKGEGA